MKKQTIKIYRIIVSGLVLLSLFGCALPVSDNNLQSFVPEDDLLVVSLTREGLNYFSQSRYIDAEGKFLEALEVAPDSVNIKFNLALTLVQEGAFYRARDILLSLLREEPESTQIMSALARLYVEMSDYSTALEYYKTAYDTALKWQEFSRAAIFARSISVIYFLIGQEESALHYSNLALNLVESPEEMCKHGKLLIALGLYQEARELILDFVTSNEVKKDACLTANLALSAYALGELSESVRFSEMVMNYRKVDSNTILVMKMLRHVALEEQKQGDVANLRRDRDSQEVVSEGEEDSFLEEFRSELGIEAKSSLYWPKNFLVFLDSFYSSAPEE